MKTFNFGGPLLPDRVWNKISPEPNSGCWIWTGCVHLGYGYLTTGSRTDGTRRQVSAHRFTFQRMIGDIPKGMHVDHLCRTTSCCNPDHLEAVTPGENCRRGKLGTNHPRPESKKTHCPKGHPYSGDNVRVTKTRTGIHRACRACQRTYARRRRAEKKWQS